MVKLNPATDAVITVRGGCITGVYAPDNVRVVVVDFDNIDAGDKVAFDTADWNEGSVSSEGARDAIAAVVSKMSENRSETCPTE